MGHYTSATQKTIVYTKICPYCNGTGIIGNTWPNKYEYGTGTGSASCYYCGGTGYIVVEEVKASRETDGHQMG